MIEKVDEIDIETFPMGDAGAQFLTILAHINGAKRKINELVDAVNELQNRIDPPSVYQVMKDKDAIIGKHIGEKQRLQDKLDRTRKALEIAVDALKKIKEECYDTTDVLLCANKALEQITAEQKE